MGAKNTLRTCGLKKVPWCRQVKKTVLDTISRLIYFLNFLCKIDLISGLRFHIVYNTWWLYIFFSNKYLWILLNVFIVSKTLFVSFQGPSFFSFLLFSYKGTRFSSQGCFPLVTVDTYIYRMSKESCPFFHNILTIQDTSLAFFNCVWLTAVHFLPSSWNSFEFQI